MHSWLSKNIEKSFFSFLPSCSCHGEDEDSVASAAPPGISVRNGLSSLGPEIAVSPARRASSAAETAVVAHPQSPPQRGGSPPRLRRRRLFSGRQSQVERCMLLREQSLDGVSQQERHSIWRWNPSPKGRFLLKCWKSRSLFFVEKKIKFYDKSFLL